MPVGVVGGKVLVKDGDVCIDCCADIDCWAIFFRCPCEVEGDKRRYVRCSDLPPGFEVGDVAKIGGLGETARCYRYVGDTERPPETVDTVGTTYDFCSECCCWYEWVGCACEGSGALPPIYVDCSKYGAEPAVGEVRRIDGGCYTYNGVSVGTLPANRGTEAGSIVADCDTCCPCYDCTTCTFEDCEGDGGELNTRWRLNGATINGSDTWPEYCDCPAFFLGSECCNGWETGGDVCDVFQTGGNTKLCNVAAGNGGGVTTAAINCAGADPPYSQLLPGEWYVSVVFEKDVENSQTKFSEVIYRKGTDQQRAECCKVGTYSPDFFVYNEIEDDTSCDLVAGTVTIEHGLREDGEP